MTEQPTHLKALEEIEREGLPGLVEVLREEGLDAARHVLWYPRKLRDRLCKVSVDLRPVQLRNGGCMEEAATIQVLVMEPEQPLPGRPAVPIAPSLAARVVDVPVPVFRESIQKVTE